MAAFAQPIDLPSGQDEAARQQSALDRATDLIRGALDGQLITRVDDDVAVLTGTGRRFLQLPQAPIVSVASVVVGGATYTEGVDYEVNVDLNALTRLGYAWPRTGLVRVTYTHGFDTVPEDLARLCAALADRVLDGSLQVRSVQESIGSKQSSVTYLHPASGRAELFSDADERVLDGYRLTLLP